MSKHEPVSQYLSLGIGAASIGVHPRTLRRRIADGSLPAYKVGRLIKVKPEDLQHLLRRIPSAGDAA